MTHPTYPSPVLPDVRAAARRLGRRRFLTVTGAAAVLAFTTHLPSAHASPVDPRVLADDPFTLGVASGDPRPDSVVLWTRLAVRPYEPDSGLPAAPLPVDWEIAEDEHFRRVVRRGTAVAHPEFHHAVHLEPDGLAPGRDYWYRFRSGRFVSPVGHTRTAPAPDARPTALRLGLAACQAYHQGYFTAHRHLAEDDLDAVVHLGDYLYEYAVDAAGGDRRYTDRTLPAHFDREAVTLADYRMRYALYKTDPDLAAAHAAHPWIVTWDDHETENNYAGDVPEDNPDNAIPPEEFLLRRAAAYRAYWENMPLRAPQRPTGADMRLYRRLRYGRLAQLDVLDTRQYRSDQANGDGWKRPGPELDDPGRTMLGAAQERWLTDGWRTSDTRWQVVAQQVVLSPRRDRPGDDYLVSMDAWDGYPAARERFLAGAEAAGVANLVVLTGDVHVHYGLDIPRRADRPEAGTAGVEIVTTSIASGGDGADRPDNYDDLRAANPHLRFYNGRRGYVRLTLQADQLRADYLTLPWVTRPGAPATVAARLVSAAGDPGLTVA